MKPAPSPSVAPSSPVSSSSPLSELPDGGKEADNPTWEETAGSNLSQASTLETAPAANIQTETDIDQMLTAALSKSSSVRECKKDIKESLAQKSDDAGLVSEDLTSVGFGEYVYTCNTKHGGVVVVVVIM
jgi:hypothetical protein